MLITLGNFFVVFFTNFSPIRASIHPLIPSTIRTLAIFYPTLKFKTFLFSCQLFGIISCSEINWLLFAILCQAKHISGIHTCLEGEPVYKVNHGFGGGIKCSMSEI